MLRPTIYDVATRAGVSISTVSLALNAPDRVKSATLARVLAAADELGFVPKTEAVTRARIGVRRIGVFAPFSSTPSYARRLNGVLRAAAEERFEVVVYDESAPAVLGPDGDATVRTPSRLASLPLTGRVDGLIVMSVPFTDVVAERLAKQHLPTTLVGFQRPGYSSVVTDDVGGVHMVAALLTRRGHERIAYLGHPEPRPDFPSSVRLAAFREALPNPPQIRLIDPTQPFEGARAAARDLLADPQRPTAVFAAGDLLASAALRAAHDLDLAVPADCAVVGYDDADLAEPLGLTTIHQPLEESGQIATEILLEQLDDPRRSTRQTTLSVRLIERDTT
jgi:LacI family transcriptional regulator, galactose operon repressor